LETGKQAYKLTQPNIGFFLTLPAKYRITNDG